MSMHFSFKTIVFVELEKSQNTNGVNCQTALSLSDLLVNAVGEATGRMGTRCPIQILDPHFVFA